MKNLQVFENAELGFKIELMLDENGNPWFPATMTARAFGYNSPEQAIQQHCKKVVKIKAPTNGGMQEMNFIPESDLCRLMMRSQLPGIEKRQDWVVDKVLHSIHKHGSYLTPKNAVEVLDNPKAILALAEEIVRQSKRINVLDKTKVGFGNQIYLLNGYLRLADGQLLPLYDEQLEPHVTLGD